jgi:hypothetical protein
MRVGIGYCNEKDALLSGKKVAENAIVKGIIDRPDFIISFCSGQLDHNRFLKGLQSVVGNKVPIIGGSTIGLITNDCLSYEGYPAGAAVMQLETVQTKVVVVNNVDRDERFAGIQLAHALAKEPEASLLFILYDSIKIPATNNTPPTLNASSPLLEGIAQELRSNVPIIGAGVIGDYDLSPPKQFCGSYVGNQSVVGTLLAGDFKPYFRIMHGCSPLDGVYHRITKIQGSNIYELDGKPIVEMIDELFGNQDWRNQHPVDLVTIGKNYGDRFGEPKEGDYVNRLITGILPNGEGIGIFEPDFEEGTEIQFMVRDTTKMIESAKRNSTELLAQIKAEGRKALFGMYIDCAGRTAKYLNTKIEEASEIQEALNRYNVPLLGFYSGVEIAPLLKKSRGLDWTGVLLILAGK